MHRRNWLKGWGATALLSAVPSVKVFSSPASAAPKRVLRIAHLTDIHLQHGKEAPQGLTDCLHHLQSLHPAPDFIFNGGDTIDDALMHTKEHVKGEWDLWDSILKNECDIPVEHCIGNHDVWGLPTAKFDSLYGKKFALERMQLDHSYRSFDKNGWHFIVLDSTHEKKNGIWYTAKLGDEQTEWLAADLASVSENTPVLILSHIPILTATVFLDDYQIRNGKFELPGGWMHTDVKEIMNILHAHPNVKLCISGHIHLADHVVYNGIHFYCNGAVAGDWWKNEYYHETRAGYAVIDLFDDGSFTNQYQSYRESLQNF